MTEPADPTFLDDRLAHWAEANPDGEAFTYLGRTWTWSQWYDRIQRLAGALTERGVNRGDVVAFHDKNPPACVETTLAAASLGAATAIINFRLAADELDYVLNDSGAKLLIDEDAGLVLGHAGGQRRLESVINHLLGGRDVGRLLGG